MEFERGRGGKTFGMSYINMRKRGIKVDSAFQNSGYDIKFVVIKDLK